MNRTGLLAAVVVMLTSSQVYAQMGGMGGMGGGMGGGVPELDAASTARLTRQNTRLAAAFTEIRRSAQVELEGGQLLSGKIDLRPIIVDGDLGQYAIAPGKIKMIRFLKPASDVNQADEAERNNNGEVGGGAAGLNIRRARQNQVGMGPGRGGGVGGGLELVGDSNSRTGTAVLTPAKVVTTAEKEIIGIIHIPSDFRLELDFGTLTLAPVKLRSITFTDDHGKIEPSKAATPTTHQDQSSPAPQDDAERATLRAGRQLGHRHLARR